MKRPPPQPYASALALAATDPDLLSRAVRGELRAAFEGVDPTANYVAPSVPALEWAGYLRREEGAVRLTERGMAVLERQRSPRSKLPSVEVLELPWGLEGEEAIGEEIIEEEATAPLAASPELAAAMEANTALKRYTRAAAEAGCELVYHAERSNHCADHFDHYEVRRGDAVVTRLCADCWAWWLLEGQKRRPITARELTEHLSAPPAPAAPTAPQACEAAAEELSPSPSPTSKPKTCRDAVLDLLAAGPRPQQEIRAGYAEGTVKGTLCKLEREGLVERYTAPVVKSGRSYASTWWRLVAEGAAAPVTPPQPRPRNLPTIAHLVTEHGFRLEGVHGDPGALRVIPPRGEGYGTLDFDDRGTLICCAWELSERREHRHRIMDLAAGISEAQLVTWLRWGREAARYAAACTARRFDELLRGVGLRLGARIEGIHPADPEAGAVAWVEWGAGLILELTWPEPWGSSHNRTYPDGATEADVAAWLAPWTERQKKAPKKASSSGPRLAAIERAVVEFGCSLEEVPDDPSKRLVRSSSPSTPLMGTLDFNDRGELVCCAWDLPWAQERAFSLSGLSITELKAWLRKSRKPVEPAPEPAPAPPEPTPPPLEEPAWSGARLIDLLATAPPVPFVDALRDLAGAEKRGLIVERDATRQAKAPGAVDCWKIATPGYLGGRIIVRVEEWPDGYDIVCGVKGAKQHVSSRAAAMEIVRAELAKGRASA